VIVKMEAKA